MKEMYLNWEAIGAIGEIIGAAAVVLSLIFLIVQIRRNTIALQTNSWQAVQDGEQRFDEYLGRDVKTLDIWARGSNQGLASFENTAERDQFWLIVKQLVGLYQNHHYMYEKGLIEEDWWESWAKFFARDVSSHPGFRDVLLELYPMLRPSFRRFVDNHFKSEKPE